MYVHRCFASTLSQEILENNIFRDSLDFNSTMTPVLVEGENIGCAMQNFVDGEEFNNFFLKHRCLGLYYYGDKNQIMQFDGHLRF